MVYIPDEWFNDKQNKDEVFKIFENNTDVILDGQEQIIMQTLTNLNEMTILKHFENGDIALDL